MGLKIQFTRNGRDTGHPVTIGPSDANDVHFKFTRGSGAPKLRYTTDGADAKGGEHTAPEGAVDVGVEFLLDANGKLTMRDSHWTDRDGKAIGGPDGYIPPPEGANDWHLEVPGGKITEAFWTKDGQSYVPRESLDVPEDANDAHLSHFQPGRRSVSSINAERAALAGLIGYLLGASTHGIGGPFKQVLAAMGLSFAGGDEPSDERP